MKKFTQLALEDTESVENNETEVIIYAEITDFEGLKEATRIEGHYQLNGEFSNGTRCRVRATTKGDEVNYTFTYKVPTSQQKGLEANKEYNIEVDKDFFSGFKAVADQAVNKTRYIFNSEKVELAFYIGEEKRIIEIPNIEYEVDVYYSKDNAVIAWCKIDVEVDGILDHISAKFPELEAIKLTIKISHLPFKPINPILTLSANDEQQKFIDQLWGKFNLAP